MPRLPCVCVSNYQPRIDQSRKLVKSEEDCPDKPKVIKHLIVAVRFGYIAIEKAWYIQSRHRGIDTYETAFGTATSRVRDRSPLESIGQEQRYESKGRISTSERIGSERIKAEERRQVD